MSTGVPKIVVVENMWPSSPTSARARRSHVRRWAAIAANVLWAAGSILLLPSGWIAPNLLGTAFIVLQAAAIALCGELQFIGLRRPMRLPPEALRL